MQAKAPCSARKTRICEHAKGPTFIFEGERADDLLNAYYNWLMAFIEQQAAQYPDAKVQLAALKDRQDPAWGI